MKINYLAQKTFKVASPLEGVNSIEKELLKESFLVVQSDGAFLSTLTPSDIVESPYQLVIDSIHHKPRVDCNQEVESVLELMRETGNYVLPVFEENEFIGVVTKDDILDYLVEYRNDLERTVAEHTEELSRVNNQLRAQIDKRKKAEKKTKASLKEKEILLSEIHHRVKNNLRVISSLLDLSSMRTQDQKAISLFTNAKSKIQTMALIHSQVYRNERFDQIHMGTYIQELVNYLLQVHETENISVTPIIECSDVVVPLTQAIPCALVLNELVSNSLKHAFKGKERGKIEISIQKSDDVVSMRVKDDGIGIPEGIDVFSSNSLGLRLVRNTVQGQLMGKIHIERDFGTTITVEFKILKKETPNA